MYNAIYLFSNKMVEIMNEANNQSILKEINPEYSLKGLILKLKL